MVGRVVAQVTEVQEAAAIPSAEVTMVLVGMIETEVAKMRTEVVKTTQKSIHRAEREG